MNAAERFFAASRAGDLDALVAELAEDVILLTPRSDEPIVGRQAAGDLLRAVEGACDEFRHTHVLVSEGADQTPLIALVYEARIGDEQMRGVDLITLDDGDRISTFVIAARPVSAIAALGRRLAAGAS